MDCPNFDPNRSYFVQFEAINFAVEGAATDLKAAGSLMLVASALMQYAQNQTAFVLNKGGCEGFVNTFGKKPGQMVSIDHRALAQNDGMADGVFQLPHVSRPGVIQQQVHVIRIKSGNLFSFYQAVFFQKVLRQQGNVLFAFP